MQRKRISWRVLLLLLFCFLAPLGCMKHVHRVGNGMQVGKGRLQRQWYALWGIVPLNRVDTHELAQGAKDYEITTFYSPIDLVLNFFTGIFSVYSRTVVVVR